MSQAKKNSRRNYSQIDKEVYELILQNKTKYIEDLEEEVDLSRRKAQKSISRLEKKGKIKTKKVMHAGKWTLQAILVDDYGLEYEGDDGDSDNLIWDTLGNLPCFTCPRVNKCSAGVGTQEEKEANPNYCEYLTDWIDAQLDEEEEYDKIFQPDFEEIRKKKKKRRKKKKEKD